MLRLFLMKDSDHSGSFALFYTACIIIPLIALLQLEGLPLKIMLFLAFFVGALALLHKSPRKTFERRHLMLLYRGSVLLKAFVISCSIMIVVALALLLFGGTSMINLIIGGLWLILLEALLFWSGMARVFLSSVQLGIKTRIIATLCGWVPVINIVMLLKVIKIVEKELAFEYEKDLLTNVAVESQQCQTKYPIMLVHGVFFRDIQYLNYWGRIPRFLKQRGAEICYGNQESAQSVAYCGEQLAANIKAYVTETGCEKVNIIAHSKGGLDSRYAISNCGMDQYVASLTTINTPHHGCIFANYLLKKVPEKVVQQVEKIYNGAFTKLGDKEPNFLEAVSCLTDETCGEFNQKAPDKAGVYYQGVATYVSRAANGKFPLNFVYPVVKHFDGRNDGLVSVESASYFENTNVVGPTGKRGISHADMIDLNRENIDGFDVREFYKDIVVDLKNRGF